LHSRPDKLVNAGYPSWREDDSKSQAHWQEKTGALHACRLTGRIIRVRGENVPSACLPDSPPGSSLSFAAWRRRPRRHKSGWGLRQRVSSTLQMGRTTRLPRVFRTKTQSIVVARGDKEFGSCNPEAYRWMADSIHQSRTCRRALRGVPGPPLSAGTTIGNVWGRDNAKEVFLRIKPL